MRVILDVNRPSSLSCGVQSCSSVEGFMEMKKLHPEDEFMIDPESYEAYQTYMERLVMQEVYNFCDEMCIEQDVLSAMIQWNSVKMNFLAPEYEAEDIAYEEYLNDYYSDYDAEIMRDVMWMNKHC